MTDRVDPTRIEVIVGASRHPLDHLGRIVTSERRVYILHSVHCLESGVDLRACVFSRAGDVGLDVGDWAGMTDRPVRLAITPGFPLRLLPAGEVRGA